MKLMIQIPCYNEALTLPQTLQDLPGTLNGVDSLEVLVIDDGSTDNTSQIAQELGVEHIIRFKENRGLARAFAAGLDFCLKEEADIIVNTDGDNQYKGSEISKIIAPILDGRVDIVIGDRQVETIRHFSFVKKFLQKLGTRVVRWTSDTDIKDATSGFRAFSKEAALNLSIFSNYTYTLETIIQAGKKGMTIASVPIETNQILRPSRLIQSNADYVLRSAATITRIFLMYEPLKIFSWLSSLPMFLGLVLAIRYLYFFLIGDGAGHVQSVIVAGVLILLSFQIFLLGLLADLIGRNREILERTLLQAKRIELQQRSGS